MSTLTIKQKINLFNKLYKEISGYGRGGDTELAHVNKYEASVLKAMGGSGTVNPLTQLREYGMFDKDGDPPPAPVSTGETTVKNVSDLPEYFKPYAEKLLATAEQVYDEPYEAYTDPVTGEAGKRLADVTDEQKMAFAGLRDLFTEVDPETGERSFKSPMSDEITESKRLAGRGARGFDEFEEGEFSETYMSPYQDAVTKIQVREAERKQEQARQARQSAAGAAGALGGSRFGIQEGVAREGDRRLLSDIELKGLQDAYTQGLTTFDADRSAARAGSNQILGLGQQEQASNLTGLGALQSTGETQRALRQQPLDLDYEEFVRQKEYPRQSLQELSGILRGFQVQPDTYKTSQNFASPPTLGSQLLTAGSLGAGISSGLGKSLFGKAGGGLASIAPEKYQEGGSSAYNKPDTYGDGKFQLSDITRGGAELLKGVPGLGSLFDINASVHESVLGEGKAEKFRGFEEGTTDIDVLTELFPNHSISEARAKWNILSPTAKNNLMDKYKTRKESSAIMSALTASDADVQRQLTKERITGGDPEANVINQQIAKTKALLSGKTRDQMTEIEKKQAGLTGIEKDRIATLTKKPQGPTMMSAQEPRERKDIKAITSEDIVAEQQGPDGSEVIEEKDEVLFNLLGRGKDGTGTSALDFFKMAALMSQPGQTTSQALLKGLTGLEEGTQKAAKAKSQEDLRKAQIKMYEGQAIRDRATKEIARIKAGATVTKERLDTLEKMTIAELTALLEAAKNTGLTPELQKQIDKAKRNIETIALRRSKPGGGFGTQLPTSKNKKSKMLPDDE